MKKITEVSMWLLNASREAWWKGKGRNKKVYFVAYAGNVSVMHECQPAENLLEIMGLMTMTHFEIGGVEYKVLSRRFGCGGDSRFEVRMTAEVAA